MFCTSLRCWIWWVTRTTFLSFRKPSIQFLKIFSATSGSTALNGSSRRTTSAFEYQALARLILAFCPPLVLIPLSPISVSRPLLKILRSWSSQQTSITLFILSSSYSRPNKIFSFKVPEIINGSCST